MLQEETREILESRRQELDGSNKSGADSSVDSRLSSQSLAFISRLSGWKKDRGREGGEGGEGRPKALVIDGATLQFVFEPSLKALFLDVAGKCVSVICSRATPIQKVMYCICMYICSWGECTL